MTLRQRVLVPHERDKSAAFARPEARRALVEHAHVVRRERADLGEAGQFKRIETEIHAPGQRHIEITAGERRTGVRDGKQRGRARAVHGVAAAFEIKLIADASGDGVGESAREGFLAHRRER